MYEDKFSKLVRKSVIFSVLFGFLLLTSVTLLLENVYAQENTDENTNSNKDKIEQRKQKLEEKKKELQEKFEKRLQKLKEKHRDEIAGLSSGKPSSEKIKKLEEKFYEKSEKIIQTL